MSQVLCLAVATPGQSPLILALRRTPELAISPAVLGCGLFPGPARGLCLLPGCAHLTAAMQDLARLNAAHMVAPRASQAQQHHAGGAMVAMNDCGASGLPGWVAL